jgi:hypothetical protein
VTREAEANVLDRLEAYKGQPALKLVCELLALRRGRYRDKLEGHDDTNARGRARECRDLIREFELTNNV